MKLQKVIRAFISAASRDISRDFHYNKLDFLFSSWLPTTDFEFYGRTTNQQNYIHNKFKSSTYKGRTPFASHKSARL